MSDTAPIAADQRRRSEELPRLVRAGRMRWWRDESSPPESFILVAVAPWSRYDLRLLDLIRERLGSGQYAGPPVYVVDFDDYGEAAPLTDDFPGATDVFHTPVVRARMEGPLVTLSGAAARKWLAAELGIAEASSSDGIRRPAAAV